MFACVCIANCVPCDAESACGSGESDGGVCVVAHPLIHCCVFSCFLTKFACGNVQTCIVLVLSSKSENSFSYFSLRTLLGLFQVSMHLMEMS